MVPPGELPLDRVFAIAGPLLAATGAVLLAYDILRGPVVWYRREFFGTRSWELQRDSHEKDMRRLRELPIPPYSEGEIRQLVDEAETRYKVLEWNRREEMRDTTLTGLLQSQKVALAGLGLVAVGSVLQSLAALLSG
jgi:hypothetical protein